MEVVTPSLLVRKIDIFRPRFLLGSFFTHQFDKVQGKVYLTTSESLEKNFLQAKEAVGNFQ